MALYADKIVPWLQDKLESREMGKQRGLALEGVSGDVLEIGLGTRVNLPYYTEHVRSLTAVEPSAGMRARAERRTKEAGWTLRLTQHSGDQNGADARPTLPAHQCECRPLCPPCAPV